MLLLFIYLLYMLYISLYILCKDIKKIPNPAHFLQIIFLPALKILKTSIFCNNFCIFAERILFFAGQK